MIKNYTSSVAPERSIVHIERSLVSHGAKNIMKNYSPTGQLDAILFVMFVGEENVPDCH